MQRAVPRRFFDPVVELLLSVLFVGCVLSGSAPIRLVNERPNACSGRVEILYGGQWGTVCDDSWGIEDANVVCRQIGCGHAIAAKEAAYFGQGSGKIWLDEVVCTGTESTLTACQHPGWEKHNCRHGDDAGVECSGPAPIIRLVNGTNACIGRVEILYGGQWGTVCDDSWGIQDANVVCRQIGCGHAIAAKESAYFGRGSGKIWLDEVGCTGTESTLTACQHADWEKHDCGHGEDAGVACSDGLKKPNISLNSTYSLFKAGENVLLSCHVPVFGMDRKVHFNFVHSPNPIAEMIVPDRENIKSHELNGLHISNGGMYTCLYEVGLQFKSQLSDPVQIDVVNLLQPNISMEPTSGEVMPGQSLVVHCTAECSYPKVMFILNQKASTENISMSSSAINNSAIFTIPAENITAGGHFFCSYEVQSQSRSLLSPPSNILRAFVPSDIKNIYIGASAGALFLVVVVILALVIFWWRRTSKQPSSAVVSHSGGLPLKDGVCSGLKPKVVNSAYHAEPTKEDYCSDEMYTNMGSHEQDSKDLSQEKLSCDQEYGNNYEILFRNPPHNEQKEMAGEEDYGTIYTQEPEDCAEAIYQNWEG